MDFCAFDLVPLGVEINHILDVLPGLPQIVRTVQKPLAGKY